jgi:hypothetical protein
MELEGNLVKYNADERKKFDVPKSVDVDTALETADSFRRIARILIKEHEDVEDDSQYRAVPRQVRRNAQNHFARAVELDRFARDTYDACGVVNPDIAPGLSGQWEDETSN